MGTDSMSYHRGFMRALINQEALAEWLAYHEWADLNPTGLLTSWEGKIDLDAEVEVTLPSYTNPEYMYIRQYFDYDGGGFLPDTYFVQALIPYHCLILLGDL